MAPRRLMISLTAALVACQGPQEETAADAGPVEVELSGTVQKGPFITGSTVTISPVDADGYATGQVYLATTTDDLGSFSARFEHLGAVSLEASGYAYNEATGRLSDAPMTLRAWHDVAAAGEQAVTINALTHLTASRISTLVASGAAPSDALAQAEQELFDALGLTDAGWTPGAPARELSLSEGSSDGNDYLFAVSAVLAQAAALRADGGSADASLQELLNLMALDLADDGALAPSYADELTAAERTVDTWAVRQALQARLFETGSAAEAPQLDGFIDTDGDGVVNAADTCMLLPNADQAVVPDGACSFRVLETEAAPDLIDGDGLLQTSLGDLNGDGRDDVVGVMYSGDLLVWLSDADGVPVYVDRVASEQWAGVVTVADVTGDGTADLLQIAPYPEDIYSYPELLLFEGAGDGTFASPIVIPGGSWRVWPEEPPQVGDFDLDGDPDIATQGCVFDAAADALTAQLGCSLDAETSVAAGDINGDGWPDLVMVGTAWYIESYVRLSDGAGGYDPVVLGGIMDRHGAIADVDGDGHLDVVLSGDEAPRLALGDGAGNFSTTSMSFEDGACTYSAVQAADLNGDGDAELMCLDITGQILRVFDASGAQTNALPMAGSTWPPSLGDTAGDGLIDVVRGTMDVSLTHASIGD